MLSLINLPGSNDTTGRNSFIETVQGMAGFFFFFFLSFPRLFGWVYVSPGHMVLQEDVSFDLFLCTYVCFPQRSCWI